MDLQSENQIPGFDDSEVGISDLGGSGYPWSSSAGGIAEQPSSSGQTGGQSISASTGSNPQFTALGHSSPPLEQAGSQHNPASLSVPAFTSTAYDLPNFRQPAYPPASAPSLASYTNTWLWQTSQLSQARLPSLTDLGIASPSPEIRMGPGSLPRYQYVNVHPPMPHFPLVESSLSTSLPHRQSHNDPAAEHDGTRVLHSSSNTSVQTWNTEIQSNDRATSNQRAEELLSDEEERASSPGSEQAEASSEFTPVCEFSRPCKMGPSPDGVHFRKVVSHLFGRNKASTKLFPETVWVFYCRKHYQRARYRAAQWPFNQCELLLQSLDRMEQWGRVRSFELRLRRREALRADLETERPSRGGLLDNGRRHPTAFTAPVPDWLQQEVGVGKSFDDIRGIVERIRCDLRNAHQELETLPQSQVADDGQVSTLESEHAPASADNFERRSFARFPDIEILPDFDSGVLEQSRAPKRLEKRQSMPAEDDSKIFAGAEQSRSSRHRQLQRSRASGMSRISTQGAVRKLGRKATKGKGTKFR
ncbi:Uncharacterized protein PECH_002345 [Penicillium ucsense]|uniref:Uncharacterized protein n=1 Tax=Penicillium ucsense TaxID=2839758 RepID=A0A8J8VWN6_9EURO|nr:Uncharacterized protein PECM_001934 [Penicillium ucsense]KAF7730932.1 Uncharacterized protein PECH_002345 [Penicillium ucsense]